MQDDPSMGGVFIVIESPASETKKKKQKHEFAPGRGEY
jgi:hypothetical protein